MERYDIAFSLLICQIILVTYPLNIAVYFQPHFDLKTLLSPRKIEIVQFASRTRQLFVRLLALVKWASNAGKVEKCAVCIVAFRPNNTDIKWAHKDLVPRY